MSTCLVVQRNKKNMLLGAWAMGIGVHITLLPTIANYHLRVWVEDPGKTRCWRRRHTGEKEWDTNQESKDRTHLHTSGWYTHCKNTQWYRNLGTLHHHHHLEGEWVSLDGWALHQNWFLSFVWRLPHQFKVRLLHDFMTHHALKICNQDLHQLEVNCKL